VKFTVLLVPPGVVVTLTVLVLSVALLAIVKVAVTVVEFTTVMPLTVTPVPDTVTAVVPVRLVPVRVTGTARVPLAGCVADVGLIPVSVGPCTVKVTAGLTGVVPIGVVTVTFLVVSPAPAVMVKVAVI